MTWYILGDEREESATKILYSAWLSFRFDEEKFFNHAKVKTIQHHQTNFATNVKGTSLDNKHREGKDQQK